MSDDKESRDDSSAESVQSDPAVGAKSGCAACSSQVATNPIYAIGAIRPQFSSLGLQREYEFERAALEEGGPSEQHNLYEVLSQSPHLARTMCWTLQIGSVDAYHLLPRSDTELGHFVEAIKPQDDGRPADTDVIIGWKGPVRECAALTLPTVIVENLYSFHASALIDTMAKTLEVKKKSNFAAIAGELFEHIRQIAMNFGEGPTRALNWAVVRFAPLFQTVAEATTRDLVLVRVEARPALLSSPARQIIDLVVTLEPRQPGPLEQHFVAVDVTDLYPHPLTTGMQPFFERATSM